jgi:transcriptional regulator with XRE-family HTH domain
MKATERNPQRVFEEERLAGEATDTLASLVQEVGVQRQELATRLGITPGRVSQVLRGGANLTLSTLAAFGWALGIRFELAGSVIEQREETPAADDPQPPAWLGAEPESSLRHTPGQLGRERGPETTRRALVVVNGEVRGRAA